MIPTFVVWRGTADTWQKVCQLFLEPRATKLFSGFYDFQANQMMAVISQYHEELSLYHEELSQYGEDVSQTMAAFP